jgi:hypothetical protein
MHQGIDITKKANSKINLSSMKKIKFVVIIITYFKN